MTSAQLPAFGVAASCALVAILEADQRRFAAFRALPQPRPGKPEGVPGRPLRLEVDHLGVTLVMPGAGRQKSDLDHVTLDDLADRGKQRGHELAFHPGA